MAAPLVKLAEDRREKIARWLDEKMGTLPADESVYAEEPKQSWKSVIMGRFATALVVVPTAVALSKIGTKDDKWIWNTEKENLGFSSLNDKLFNTPGLEAGKRLEKSDSDFAKKLGSKITNVPYLTKTIAFEAFYTSVCTAGLYFSSRFIARLTGKKDEPAKPEATETPARHARNTTPAAQGEAAHGDTAPTPKASENLKSAPRKAPAATTFGGRYEVAAAEAPSLVKAL